MKRLTIYIDTGQHQTPIKSISMMLISCKSPVLVLHLVLHYLKIDTDVLFYSRDKKYHYSTTKLYLFAVIKFTDHQEGTMIQIACIHS